MRGLAQLHTAWASFAAFYRIHHRSVKVSGLRPVLYTVLGYAMAGGGPATLLWVNLAAVIGLLLFFGAYGNYWDWRLMGEENGTQAVAARHGWSPRTALLCTMIPWAGIVPAVWWARSLGLSLASEAFFWVVGLCGVIYIAPGIRLKERRWGFFLPIVAGSFLFLQAYTLHGHSFWGGSVLIFCVMLWLVQCQAEFLHLLDDGWHCASEPVYLSQATLLAWLNRLPWLSCGLSLVAAPWNPVFLNTTLWSLIRVRAIRRLSPDGVSQQRRQLWHPLWSLYEFGLYAVAALLHRFR